MVLDEAQEGKFNEPIKVDNDLTRLLVDEYYRIFNLVHGLSSYALPTTTITYEDDNWVEGLFLLVPCEEQEYLALIHDGLMREPSLYH